MAATARKDRYQSGGTVYGNLAYDLDREVLRRELDHAGEARREKVQAAPGCGASPMYRSGPGSRSLS